MNTSTQKAIGRISVPLILLITFLLAAPGYAHCDTMQGPVVQDAQKALEREDPASVLKWVGPEQENELKANFAKAVALRKQGALAREVADRFFFETAVRLHREFEHAPYTGIKATDDHVPAYIKQLDAAIESGDIVPLMERILMHTRQTIRDEFQQTVRNRQLAESSVNNGRLYVESYVDFIHHVQAIVQAVHGETTHAPQPEQHNCN